MAIAINPAPSSINFINILPMLKNLWHIWNRKETLIAVGIKNATKEIKKHLAGLYIAVRSIK